MAIEKAAEAVFGAAGPGLTLYTGAFKAYPELLPAYRYHFLTNGKPATHLAALTHLKRKELREGMPKALETLLKHVEANGPPFANLCLSACDRPAEKARKPPRSEPMPNSLWSATSMSRLWA